MPLKRTLLTAIPFVILLLASLFHFPALRWLEQKSIDWRFEWRGARPTTGEIVVVAIDEKSLNREGRWPWPRKKIAQLIKKMNEAEPSLIEMDLIFAEPDPDDKILIQALSEKKNTILGYFFYRTQKELQGADISTDAMEKNEQRILPTALPEITGLSERLHPMSGVVVNTESISHSALTQGYFNAFPDSDGVIRRFPLVTTYKGSLFPSLGLETFSQHQNGFAPVPNKDRDGTFTGFSVGDRFIPTNQKSEILINYRGNEDQFQVLSATDFLQNKISPGSLAGKTVILGATAIGIYDLRVTPISSNLPGVLVQANLLDNLYQGDFLTENLWTRLASLLLMLVFTILLGLLLPRLRILLGLLMTLILTAVHLFLVQSLFHKGILLSLVTPLLTIFFIFMTITIHRALTEELQKRRLRNAFRSYLHPDIVEELVRDPKKLKLGGQSSECTILFADVRNFTSISEKLSPETLVQMMNDYFDPISQEILKEGGYIDKFIGDAVMAIFGAPNKLIDHPYRACRAAIAMKNKVDELNIIFQKKFGIQEFRIGIGMHTGPVIIGNIGTSQRLNYTVMGDSVNLASRLESANKDLGTTILISEQTFEKCANEVVAKLMEEISVKGKEEKIRVYELKKIRVVA